MADKHDHHILGLDIIRFLAASMVMVHHYDWQRDRISGSWAGWVGVEVFFVLSGFVIAYSSVGSAPAVFLRNRIVRLMPSVWLCGTATAIALALAGRTGLLFPYVRTLVLWPLGPWIDMVYWTLPVEVVFYALVWLTLFRLPLISLESVFVAITVATATYWGARSALLFIPNSHAIAAILGVIPYPLIILAGPAYGSYFALGGFIYLSFQRGLTLWRLMLVLLCIGTGAVQIVFTSSDWTPTHHEKIIPIVIWLVLTILIVLSIWANAFLARVFGRWAKVVRLIGLSTYPLYLLHDDIGRILMQQLMMPRWLVTILMICASMVVAGFFEPRLQKPLKSILRGFRPSKLLLLEIEQ